MPNLTAPLPRKTGDLQTDFDELYHCYISLVDEMKSILCNLDSGNVTEAGSVKVQNLDASQAKIKDAQIASLTADKLTAGVIDAGQITVQGANAAGRMELTGDYLVFLDKDNRRRIFIGNENGNMVFWIWNGKSGAQSQGIEMTQSGEITMTGNIETSKDCKIWGELKVGLSGNNTKGISFFGDTNSSVQSQLYGSFKPYVANNEDFRGVDFTGGTLSVNGSPVVTENTLQRLLNNE